MEWEKPSNWDLWLVELKGKPIGFGVVKHLSDGDWLTGGILLEYRGRGFGTELFKGLIERSKMQKLDVFATNEKALRVYRKLGFVETKRVGAVITMERRFHDGALL